MNLKSEFSPFFIIPHHNAYFKAPVNQSKWLQYYCPVSPLLWKLTLPLSPALYWFRLERVNNFDLKSSMNVLENRLCLSTQKNILFQKPEELMKYLVASSLSMDVSITPGQPHNILPPMYSPQQHIIPRQLSCSLSTGWAPLKPYLVSSPGVSMPV